MFPHYFSTSWNYFISLFWLRDPRPLCLSFFNDVVFQRFNVSVSFFSSGFERFTCHCSSSIHHSCFQIVFSFSLFYFSFSFLICKMYQKTLDAHKHKKYFIQGTSETLECSLITHNSTVDGTFGYLTLINWSCSNVICGTNRCWWVQGLDLIASEVKNYVLGCFEVVM